AQARHGLRQAKHGGVRPEDTPATGALVATPGSGAGLSVDTQRRGGHVCRTNRHRLAQNRRPQLGGKPSTGTRSTAGASTGGGEGGCIESNAERSNEGDKTRGRPQRQFMGKPREKGATLEVTRRARPRPGGFLLLWRIPSFSPPVSANTRAVVAATKAVSFSVSAPVFGRMDLPHIAPDRIDVLVNGGGFPSAEHPPLSLVRPADADQTQVGKPGCPGQPAEELFQLVRARRCFHQKESAQV